MKRNGEKGGEAYRLRIRGSGVGAEGKERWDERDEPKEEVRGREVCNGDTTTNQCAVEKEEVKSSVNAPASTARQVEDGAGELRDAPRVPSGRFELIDVAGGGDAATRTRARAPETMTAGRSWPRPFRGRISSTGAPQKTWP